MGAVSFDTENQWYGYCDNAYISPIFDNDTEQVLNTLIEDMEEEHRKPFIEEIQREFERLLKALKQYPDMKRPAVGKSLALQPNQLNLPLMQEDSTNG